jgi:hypothetical protein
MPRQGRGVYDFLRFYELKGCHPFTRFDEVQGCHHIRQGFHNNVIYRRLRPFVIKNATIKLNRRCHVRKRRSEATGCLCERTIIGSFGLAMLLLLRLTTIRSRMEDFFPHLCLSQQNHFSCFLARMLIITTTVTNNCNFIREVSFHNNIIVLRIIYETRKQYYYFEV